MLPITDHSFTNYVSDGNARAETEGTKTAYCDYGCQATHTIADRVEEPDQIPDNSGAVVVIVAALCAIGVAAAVAGVAVRKKIKK